MKIEKDGNMYCVTPDSHINLQESSEYFFVDEAEYQAFISQLREEAKAEAEREIFDRGFVQGDWFIMGNKRYHKRIVLEIENTDPEPIIENIRKEGQDE